MASLSSCWLFVERNLLAEGYEKWQYLRFFVHPFLIVICQVILLAKLIRNWLSISATSVYTLLCYILHLILRFMRYLQSFCFAKSEFEDVSDILPDDCDLTLEDELEQFCSLVPYKDDFKDIDGHDHQNDDTLEFQEFFNAEEDDQHFKAEDDQLFKAEKDDELFEAKEADHHNFEFHFDLEKLRRECSDLINQDNQQNNEEESTVSIEEEQPADDRNCYSDFSNLGRNSERVVQSEDLSTEKGHQEDHEFSKISCSFEFDCKQEVSEKTNEPEESTDLFYSSYCAKMWWFDQLNTERRYAVSTILSKKLGDASLLKSIVPMNFTLLELANKEIAKSLKSDFEAVYVAQTSLCWEALQYQHRKVESIFLEEQKVKFQSSISSKFQQFQILLERFLENEDGEGKRFWNYAHTRSTVRDLLQVPDISGGYMQNNEGRSEREMVTVGELLETLDKAIRVFWNFLKTDNKKSKRMFHKFLSFDSQVEDPRDLQLFDNLTKELNKKKNGLKEMKKKTRVPKRTTPMDDYQTTEMFFSMVDIEIISRVLKMSVITTEQLYWCQEKLKNIAICQGRILRTFAGSLFPSS